jgi:hypothetical protein
MNKFLNIVMIFLTVIALAGVIYLAIPKYQIQTIKVDENYILITKLNTLTGEVSIQKLFSFANNKQLFALKD